MERALRIWTRAGWRVCEQGVAGLCLTNEDESEVMLMHRGGSVELL
jgi:hypothetical protein